MVLCAQLAFARSLLRMRRSSWSVVVAGLAIASLGIVGGTTIDGQLGPLAVGYGALLGLAAMYALSGLALRDRPWRRLRRDRAGSRVETVASHRVF